jgi:hypothetical protein
MEWQPIETAPIDTPILVFCQGVRSGWAGAPCEVFVVCATDDGDFYIEHDADGGFLSWQGLKPTLWAEISYPEVKP